MVEFREQSRTVSRPRARWTKTEVTAVVAIAILIAAAGVLYVTVPPSPDQWFLDYTGWMVTRGAVPYETFTDGNWPCCHWSHAISTALFGRNEFSWRLFDFLVMLACTLGGVHLLRTLYGRAAAFWMLVLYPCLYVCQGYWFAGQRDVLGGHLCFLVFWFYWCAKPSRDGSKTVTREGEAPAEPKTQKTQARQEPRPPGLELRSGSLKWHVGTGACIATATLLKPTFAAVGLLLVCSAAIGVYARTWRFRVAALHIGVAGLASFAWIGVGFLVLTLQGTSLSMFWEMAVDNISLRFGTAAPPTAEILRRAAWYTITCWHWIVAIAVLGVAIGFRTGGRKELEANTLFLLMWVVGLVSYIVQVTGLVYTMGVMYAALIPLMCVGLGWMTEQLIDTDGWRRYVALSVLLLAIAGTAKKWSSSFSDSLGYLTGRISAPEYLGRSSVGDGITTWEAMQLARELRQLVPEDGSVLVWGRANAINYLAGRVQPTRFHHNVVLIQPGIPPRLEDRWNRWFRDDLERSHPEFCVVNLTELTNDSGPSPPSAVFLEKFLEQYYDSVRKIGRSMLYRHKRR